MARQKTMSAKMFRSLGLLQEVNRLFLHPRGLALAVTIELDGPVELVSLGPIYDSRNDPIGCIFAEGVIDADAARAVEDMRIDHLVARIAGTCIDDDGVQMLEDRREDDPS